MRVALFGGTGFVGGYLVDALLAAGHQPQLLVRPGSEDKLRQPERCNTVSGSIAEREAIAKVLESADAAIYNIGILRELPAQGISFEQLHFEGARRCMNVAQEAGVERFLLMSANGAKAEGTAYQRTKYKAEQYLQTTDLGWTIFQPSVLFGDPRGNLEFATQLQRDIVRSPFPAPLFFAGLDPRKAGKFRMSPAHVTDVARAFAIALENPNTIGQTYPLGGPESLTWKQILTRIAEAGGNRLLAVPVPTYPLQAVAFFMDRFPQFPITRDQLRMLLEGNTCDPQAGFIPLGIDDPIPFDITRLAYLAPPSTPGMAGASGRT
jgi:NADH dehydrogenase